MKTLSSVRKRDLVNVRVNGSTALVLVLEVGQDLIIGYSMCTGRVVRIKNPRIRRVRNMRTVTEVTSTVSDDVPSPIAEETKNIMSDIMSSANEYENFLDSVKCD